MSTIHSRGAVPEVVTEQPLSDHDIVAGFHTGEVTGGTVMARLLEKVNLGHRAEELLVRADGSTIPGETGEPLRAVDYLAVAGAHPMATESILGFVGLDETDPNFPRFQDVMATMITRYLPPQPSTT